MRELIYKGSTKDIYQLSGEELLFSFSDRYSIFDYGEMPNLINGKGKSTRDFTFNIYREIENKLNIKTHLLRKGEADNELIVKKFQVPRDFDSKLFYQKRPTEIFIPLEVIFRFGASAGSSLLKRGDYKENEEFKTPLVEFSTKLESIDRLLLDSEAMEIAGMNSDELNELKETTIKIAAFLKQKLDVFGLKLWDGKFEFAYTKNDTHKSLRQLVLVDSISLDELRITLEGMTLSKEVLRNLYKNSQWYAELSKYKELKPDHFRDLVSKPPQINPEDMKLIANMYQNAQGLISGTSKDLELLKSELVKIREIQL